MATPLKKYLSLKRRLREFVKSQADREELPTWKALARRFRTNYDTIEDIVHDCEELEMIVGIRSGAGVHSYPTRGEYRIEYMG
jgi:hypothetical protein